MGFVDVIADKWFGIDPPKIPASLATSRQLPSLTTKIQSEAASALRDLEERRKQAGSRRKSNVGIPQLQPLPQLQGPQLGAKLG